MRLLCLTLGFTLAIACVPDVGDDDEATEEPDPGLPDEQECLALYTGMECSEELPCDLIESTWQTCNWGPNDEYPDCPCAGLEYGFSGTVD